MENSVLVQAAEFLRKRRNNRRWRGVVFCMAVLVVCGTAWVLSQKGWALTAPEEVLDCSLAIHVHNTECLDARGNLICKKADFVFHTHNDICYDEDGELACRLSEIEVHDHGEDCFETEEVLACGYESISPDKWTSAENNQNAEEVELICQIEEHVHDGNCYEAGEKILICGLEEGEEHIHNGECYIEGETILVCGREEHGHGEDCYMVKTPEIEQNRAEETEGHIHEEACYEVVRKLICGKKGVHIHDDNCYNRGALICEVPCTEYVEEHIHRTECFKAEEDIEYIAVFENDDMIVTAAYKKSTGIPEEAQLTVEEITEESDLQHYEECLAALEENEDPLLENAVPAMLLQVIFYTDDEIIIPEDTVSFTVQFLDDSVYAEGDTVTVACFGEENIEVVLGTDIDDEGITDFEAGEFSELAFMITEERNSGVLTYESEDYIVTVNLGEGAEIPEEAQLVAERITKESDLECYEQCLSRLTEAEDILEEEEIVALLFDMKILADGEEVALQGAADVTVQFLNNDIYFESDAVKAVQLGGEAIKLLSAADIDGENSTSFETEELAKVAFITEDIRILSYEGDGFIVTARFKEAAGIPEKAELIAERITRESAPENFAECEDELREQAEEKFIVMDALMKIGFYVDGREIEPKDTVEVKIQLLDRDDLKPEEDDSRQVVHFAEDGVKVLEDADIFEDEGNSLSTTFRTDSFSYYAVTRETNVVMTAEDFHYAMERAEDGDEIVIGANIDFEKPDFSYNRNTRPGELVEVEGIYKDYHLGENGDVIIAKLLTPGQSTDEHKHITLDLNGYTLRLLGDNMTLVDVCWGAELTLKDSWAEKSEEEKAADPRPEVYSRSYQITTSTVVDSKSGRTVESTEIRTAVGGAIVGNGYREDLWQDDTAHANNWSTGGNRSAAITMWFGKLNFESGIIAENGNRAIRSRGGEINLDGGYLLDNAAKEYYTRGEDNVYTGNTGNDWFGDYGEGIGGAVVCEEVPGFNSDWVSGAMDPTTGLAARAPGTVNLRGTILSGNRALQGGAINATGCNFTISGGVVTHNRAYYRVWGGGGGGIKVNAGTLTMTNGQITSNEVWGGGGGICISRQSDVHLLGGIIAGNTTASGVNGEGGGVALYEEWVKEFVDAKDKDGNVDPDNIEIVTDEEGNIVYNPDGSEKKGYYVVNPHGPTAYIGDPNGNNGGHKLYITNNHSMSEIDWGGGGLFVSEGSTAYVYYTLITENSAKGFGGGLSGCATGRILDFSKEEEGAAIFGNSASGDAYAGAGSTKHEDMDYTQRNANPVFWERGADGRYLFQDYFSALYSKLGNTMLGGGSENWDGSMDGKRLSAVTPDNEGKWTASYVAGLTANPTENDKAKAKNFTCAYITGNTSVTHGGGIMCNGILSIGHGELEISSAMQLKGTKAIKDGDKTITTMVPDQFTFTVYAEKPSGGGKLGDIVSVGTNDANGNIEFDRLLTFQQEGWVHYYVVEDKVSDKEANIGITTDTTVYLISLWVQKVKKPNPERYFYDIRAINLETGKITEVTEADGTTSYKFNRTGEIYVDGYNHGYGGDQKYHSEDHPLILDLTKGVMKYEYPDYHIVTEYKKAPRHTFTNVKEGITEVKVTKIWDGWEGGMPADVTGVKVKLYKDGNLYDGDGAPIILNTENDWSAGWTGLSGNSKYSVKEILVYSNGTEVEAEEKCEVQYEYATTGTTADVKITNTPKTYGIELIKCDENGTPLPGARFEISKNEDGSEPLEFLQSNDGYILWDGKSIGRVSTTLITSDDDRDGGVNAGRLNIFGLPEGTYYLIETAAPFGYIKTADHTIVLGGSEGPQITCAEEDCGGHTVDNSDKDIFRFELIDKDEEYELPETGGFGAIYIRILGTVLMSGILVLLYRTNRRRGMSFVGKGGK